MPRRCAVALTQAWPPELTEATRIAQSGQRQHCSFSQTNYLAFRAAAIQMLFVRPRKFAFALQPGRSQYNPGRAAGTGSEPGAAGSCLSRRRRAQFAADLVKPLPKPKPRLEEPVIKQCPPAAPPGPA